MGTARTNTAVFFGFRMSYGYGMAVFRPYTGIRPYGCTWVYISPFQNFFSLAFKLLCHIISPTFKQNQHTLFKDMTGNLTINFAQLKTTFTMDSVHAGCHICTCAHVAGPRLKAGEFLKDAMKIVLFKGR